MALKRGQPQPGALGTGELTAVTTRRCTSAALQHAVLCAGV
jgi:hypothetical protein